MHEEKRKCRKRRRVLTYYFKALRDSPTNKRVKFKFFRLALMACHSRLSCCLKNLWNCSWLERKGFLLCLHCPWSSLLTPSILTYFLRPESEVPFLGSLPRPGYTTSSLFYIPWDLFLAQYWGTLFCVVSYYSCVKNFLKPTICRTHLWASL
jgi:hypothetical protein